MEGRSTWEVESGSGSLWTAQVSRSLVTFSCTQFEDHYSTQHWHSKSVSMPMKFRDAILIPQLHSSLVAHMLDPGWLVLHYQLTLRVLSSMPLGKPTGLRAIRLWSFPSTPATLLTISSSVWSYVLHLCSVWVLLSAGINSLLLAMVWVYDFLTFKVVWKQWTFTTSNLIFS